MTSGSHQAARTHSIVRAVRVARTGIAVATRIASFADVSEETAPGEDTSVWHLTQVRKHAVLGRGCVVGRDAYIGEGVVMGGNCKVQNYVLMYEPTRLADGVFIGPAVMLTNGHFPRAVNPDGSLKSAADWEPVGVIIEQDASIGAHAVCVAPVRIGAWTTVAVDTVVTKDVPAYTLVAGVPTRRIGWVGRVGEPLTPSDPGPDGTSHQRYLITGTLYEQFDAEPAARSGSQSSSESTIIRGVTH